MGLYQYTLRSDTKTVEGTEIGHYQFAYKLSYRWDDRRYDFMCDTKSRHAANAREKLAHVRYFVQGEWGYADDKEGLPIYRAEDGPRAEFTEEMPKRWPIVGVLRRTGRKFRIDPIEPWMQAYNDRIGQEA